MMRQPGAIQEAKKLGFRVPQDLSIVGFDDIQFAQYCDPPLTTISQPRYEIGRQAMLMMPRFLFCDVSLLTLGILHYHSGLA